VTVAPVPGGSVVEHSAGRQTKLAQFSCSLHSSQERQPGGQCCDFKNIFDEKN
jgi:hypothetical protein